MLPRDERNTDREDALRRSQLRPVSTIAVQDQTAREKASQVLVDSRILQEQQDFIGNNIPLQYVPGENISTLDPWVGSIERTIISNPETMMNPVKVVPHRTTISGVLKEKMGVANVRALTKGGAVPSQHMQRLIPPETENAFGTSTKEKTVKNTPVRSLNFIDQFFNWLNALLS